MAGFTVSSDYGVQESKICHCFQIFPFYLPWSGGTRCHDLHFLNIEFLSQIFHSSLSHSSRDFLVLYFTRGILNKYFTINNKDAKQNMFNLSYSFNLCKTKNITLSCIQTHIFIIICYEVLISFLLSKSWSLKLKGIRNIRKMISLNQSRTVFFHNTCLNVSL